jgi:diguanylate cyclase (GGDEF)-like protein
MTLSVPTVYLVIALNLLAVGIVWTFVARRYPKFPAAAVWAVGCLIGAVGAAISLLRGSVDPLLPIVVGNMLLMLMSWSAWFGLRIFYGHRVSWLLGLLSTAVFATVLAVFVVWDDLIAARIVIFSFGQAIPIVLMICEIAARRGRRSYGADLALGALGFVLFLYVVRSVAGVMEFGGPMTLREFNSVQGAVLVMLVFAAMISNFGFLLMTVDRLRNDIAVLALSDDLTGVANRRHLLKRLADECSLSARTEEPFSILVMDLDEFKGINDSHGHGAGDESLRAFSHAVQGRLRASDLLARIGGDEFCVVLPRTTVLEAGIVADDLLTICSRSQVRWNGVGITLTTSIGVAQWLPAESDTPERIMAAADQMLYDAKRHGKDRHALYGGSEAADPGVPQRVPPSSSVAHLRSA